MESNLDCAKKKSGLIVNDVIVIMTITTLFSPILVITSTYWNGGLLVGVGFWIIAPIWTFAPSWFSYEPNFQILIPLTNPVVMMFSVVPIIFAIQVVRYSQGKTGYWNTLSIGVLYFFLLLLILFFNSMLFLLQEGIVAYSGPVPIQLLIGYCLLRYFKKKAKQNIWID